MAAYTASSGASGANRRLCLVLPLRAGCSCAFQLFFQQLLLIQVRVISAASEEFVMRAALADTALAQDDDLVGVAHGRSAVRDQNGSAPVHDAPQAREDALFGLRVDAGQRIVEDQYAWVADNGAGNGGALLLAAREGDTALTNYGFIFVGEAFDVRIEAGDLRGLANLVEIVIREDERDIAANGFAEQVSVLRNVADGTAQSVKRPFTDATTVDENFDFWCLPDSRDQ